MHRLAAPVVLVALFTGLVACGDASSSSDVPNVGDGTVDPQAAHNSGDGIPDADAMGIHWARGAHSSGGGGGGRSPLMVNHGGKVMTATSVTPIFWGTSWATYAGDKMTGIDTYYAGFGGSNYAATSDEYTGTNGQVTSAVTSAPHVVDTSAAAGGGNTSTILAEVCKLVSSSAIAVDPTGNGYYPVYTDVPRGHASYCAWHASGICSGQPLQFAFFFKLDADAGCDPQDGSGLHSQGLAALANVSGHELSEARTDPSTTSATGAGAWYDSAGQENGDKCAWTFGAPLVTFSNGSQWKIQGEWSNAAYTAGTGYANSSGQKGCLSGL